MTHDRSHATDHLVLAMFENRSLQNQSGVRTPRCADDRLPAGLVVAQHHRDCVMGQPGLPADVAELDQGVAEHPSGTAPLGMQRQPERYQRKPTRPSAQSQQSNQPPRDRRKGDPCRAEASMTRV